MLMLVSIDIRYFFISPAFMTRERSFNLPPHTDVELAPIILSPVGR